MKRWLCILLAALLLAALPLTANAEQREAYIQNVSLHISGYELGAAITGCAATYDTVYDYGWTSTYGTDYGICTDISSVESIKATTITDPTATFQLNTQYYFFAYLKSPETVDWIYTFEGFSTYRVTATGVDGISCEKVFMNKYDGYIALCLPQFVQVTIPFTKIVEQGGAVAPGAQTFELEMLELGYFDDEGLHTVDYAPMSVQTYGTGSFTGNIVFTGNKVTLALTLRHCFVVAEKQGNASGWTYSDVIWEVEPKFDDACNLTSFSAAKLCWEESEGKRYLVYAEADKSYDTISFTNIYTNDNVHVCYMEQKYNSTEHWYECVCSRVTDLGAHSYGDWVITREPAEGVPGEKEHTCKICGYSETAEIEAEPVVEPEEPVEEPEPEPEEPDLPEVEEEEAPPKTGEADLTVAGHVLLAVLLLGAALILTKKRERDQ